MPRRIRDKNIWIVYGAVLLLGIAYGIAVALTSLYLDARGYDKQRIGVLATCFAGGIVAASFPAGWFVRRFSAKTTLGAALAGYAVCVAAFPHLRPFPLIASSRFLDGAFSVAIWVSCETILLSRAERGHKALVTTFYAMALAMGYVVGPIVAAGIAKIAPLQIAFTTSAVLAAAACAVVVVGLDRDRAGGAEAADADADAEGPLPASGPPSMSPRTAAILRRTRTSCFATFAYGYFQTSVVLFLPLYLMHEKGIARDATILIPAFFAAGMLLVSSWAGRLGDRHGHLLVMRALGVVGTMMVLSFVFLWSLPAMCVAVFVAGATLASISPVSLALQGVVTAPRDYARSNAIYNAFYATGMLIGPPVSSLLFERYGGGAMLFHLAAIWTAFVAFCTICWRDDPAAAARQLSISRASAAR